MSKYTCGLTLLALLGAALWGGFRENAAMVSREIQVKEINTRAFDCDGKSQELDTQLSGTRIRKAYFWFGAYSQTYADIGATLELVNANGAYQSIAKMNWDRYAEPTGIAGETVWFDYTPDWIRVQPDERLILYASCAALDEVSRGKKAHVIALIYYVEE